MSDYHRAGLPKEHCIVLSAFKTAQKYVRAFERQYVIKTYYMQRLVLAIRRFAHRVTVKLYEYRCARTGVENNNNIGDKTWSKRQRNTHSNGFCY